MDAKLPPFDDHARLFQLLETNYYPTSLDKTFLGDAISKYEKKSKQLEQRIDSVQTQLADLIAKKETVDLKLRMAKGVCVPIRCIPEEILGKIFYWCSYRPKSSGDEPFIYWPDHMASSQNVTPFSLAQVCRRWKRITFQTPKLFTSIYIPKQLSNGSPNPFTIAPVSLKHSGTLPLEIYVDPQSWGRGLDSEISLLFGELRKHLYRITTLVTSAGPHLEALFPEGTTMELPALRRLEFVQRHLGCHTIRNPRVGQLVIEGLRVLNLGDFSPRPNFLRFGEHLRGFRVDYQGMLEVPRLIAFFHQSHPNLKYLELYYGESEYEAPIDIPLQPIYLPELTHFSLIWGFGAGNLRQVLSRLRTGKLNTLKIYPMSNGDGGDILPALLEWLSPSKCDLRNLTIGFQYRTIDHDYFYDLLGLFPSLNRLVFSSANLSKELISLLNRYNNPEIFPKLTELDLASSEIPQEETFNMIHSRASRLPDLPDLELLKTFRVDSDCAWESVGDDEGAALLHDEFDNVYPQLTVHYDYEPPCSP